jgi:hypothetical protein
MQKQEKYTQKRLAIFSKSAKLFQSDEKSLNLGIIRRGTNLSLGREMMVLRKGGIVPRR